MKGNQVKLPWSFRIRQAWELIWHGTDTRYESALATLQQVSIDLDEAMIDRKLYRLTLMKVEDYARGTDAMLHALVSNTLNH